MRPRIRPGSGRSGSSTCGPRHAEASTRLRRHGFSTSDNTRMTLDSADPKPPTPFDQLGGVAGVRALVDRFYDLMDLDPDFAELRALPPTPLDGSRDKFAWFLPGWLGGPDLYIERFGHPRLRARHLPYPI